MVAPNYLVSIPPSLIKILAPLGPHFIRVGVKDKQPVDKEWQKHPYNAEDPELQAWLKSGNNYGVYTGNGLTVVEIDRQELKDLAKKSLPETFTVQSPGSNGLHFYFLCALNKSIPLINPLNSKDNWAHIKGDGGQVLGPRSIHPNGLLYYIYKDVPLAQITPRELREVFSPYMRNQEEVARAIETSKDFPEIKANVKDLIPLAGMQQIGEEYFGPHPLHGSTTGKNFHINPEKNVWCCFRCDSGGGPLQWIAVQEGIISCEESKPGALKGDKFWQVVEAAKKRGIEIPNIRITKDDFHKVSIDSAGREHIVPDMKAILDHLRTKYIFKTTDDTEQLYVYQDGIYIPTETLVKEELENILHEDATTHLTNEVIAHLNRASYCKRTIFNQFHGQIPVENGLLAFTKTKLQPHSPDNIFTFKIQATYDLNAECPNFKKFLLDILPNEEDRKLIQEYCGYTLYPDLPFHKILFLYGVGRNGKGTLVRTLESILGQDNVSAIPLEAFDGTQRFQVANLYGKLMNVCSEPVTRKTYNTETLKKALGQDRIDGEIKNKQKPISFTNFAKFFVMGNRFPLINDRTLSWWDRLQIINFEKTFTHEQENIIPNIEKQWLNDQKERSGILNWLVDGLTRLIENRGFSTSKSQHDMMIQFKQASDSIGAFIEERLEYSPIFKQSMPELYASYKEYVEENGIYLDSENKFGRRMKELPKAKFSIDKIYGKSVRMVKGLRVKISSTDSTDTTLFISPKVSAVDNTCIDLTVEKTVETVETVEASINPPVEPNLAHVTNDKSCTICGNPILDGERWTIYKGYKVHLPECYKMASEAP